MRFDAKKTPKEGDVRIVQRFLLLPYRYNNEIVWLETVRIKQRAERWYDMTCGACGIRWQDVEILRK